MLFPNYSKIIISREANHTQNNTRTAHLHSIITHCISYRRCHVFIDHVSKSSLIVAPKST